MITQFTVSFSRTVNLGNFESARTEASVTVSVPEDRTEQSLCEMKKMAQVELRKLLEETYRNQYVDRRKTTQT